MPEQNWVSKIPVEYEVALMVKNPPANAGDIRDMGLILGSARSPGKGNGNPLQNSCLENSMDRGSWRAAVHGVPKNHTCLMPEVWEAHKFRLNLTLWKIPCTYFSVYHLATIPPWAGKIPWSRKWQLTPEFLPGKFHGQRSLAGYSPWGRKESDTTEHIHTYF